MGDNPQTQYFTGRLVIVFFYVLLVLELSSTEYVDDNSVERLIQQKKPSPAIRAL